MKKKTTMFLSALALTISVAAQDGAKKKPVETKKTEIVYHSQAEKDKEGKPLVGKSYLVVAVPMYIQWDQPEVSK